MTGGGVPVQEERPGTYRELRGRPGHPALAQSPRAAKDSRGSGKAGASSALGPGLGSLTAW